MYHVEKGRLKGERCKDCHKVFSTPQTYCHVCGGRGFDIFLFNEMGTVRSYTVIHVPLPPHESPYTIAIVELDQGADVIGRVKGGELKIGKKVKVVPECPDGKAALVFCPI